MKYLLDEEEFQALRDGARTALALYKDELQRVCTLAAKHTPVKLAWDPNSPPRPWGCILDADSDPGYCDECPVQDECPNPSKEWSK